MKFLMSLLAVPMFFLPLTLDAQKRQPVKPAAVRHVIIEKKLDTIVFPKIAVSDLAFELCVTEISRYSSRFDPSGTGVKVVFVREKHPAHYQKYMRLEKLPPIRLNMKNVTLRQVLDELKKQSGCDYEVKKDHVEFIHKYVSKGVQK